MSTEYDPSTSDNHAQFIDAVRHDFEDDPAYWDTLWQQYSTENPDNAKQLNLHATRLGEGGVEAKFAFLQGILFSYALLKKQGSAADLAILVHGETAPASPAPEHLLGAVALQPTILDTEAA